MAGKYDVQEYEKLITSNALRALRAYEKSEGKLPLQQEMKMLDDFRAKLRDWKSMEDMSRAYEYALNDYNSDSLMWWLQGDKSYKAPDEYEGQSEASKILPLLYGIADEGSDWYTMGTQNLKREAKRLGYPVDLPGAFDDFLKLVGNYQVQYDRAQLLREGQQGLNYWLNKLFYPASTQEAENAVLTGEGGDPETLKKLRMLDGVTSGAMALAPSLSFARVNPLLMGTIDAGLQGLAEGARQYGTGKLSTTGQEANYNQALAALMLGATRPGMTMTAGGAASQLPTKAGKDFARGFVKGARTGGGDEASRVKEAVKLYNKDIVPVLKNGGQIKDMTGQKYADAVKVPEMAKLFGIEAQADGKYIVDDMVDMYHQKVYAPKVLYTSDDIVQYDRPAADMAEAWELEANPISGKTYSKTQRILNRFLGMNKPKSYLGFDNYDQFAKLFPERAADLNAGKAAMGLGTAGGALAASVGSRVEPIIKTNPLKLMSDESGSMRKSYTESYKTQPWYKKLTVESKKIIDEAFKRKAEEEEAE